MAEGYDILPENTVCRHFLTNSCREGDNCPLPHDPSRTVPDNVCRFFLRGSCRFGSRCTFSHAFLKHSTGSRIPGGQYAKAMRRESQFKYVNDQSNGQKTNSERPYADASRVNLDSHDPQWSLSSELCPYFVAGDCPLLPECKFIHGELCSICERACLHPYNEQQRRAHLEFCEKEMLQDMEFSFAVQRSVEKTCGICMEVVMEKQPRSRRRFGILEKCNHVFCLSCIRTWRSSRSNGSVSSVIRSCPECRVPSDFVTPSSFWFESEEQKAQLIEDYKAALKAIPCKHFKQGDGECPFGGLCFYLHAMPDGTKVDLPVPTRRQRRQRRDQEIDLLHLGFENLSPLDMTLEDSHSDDEVLMHLQYDSFEYLWSDSDDDGSNFYYNHFINNGF